MDDAVNQQGTLWDSSETTSRSPKHRVRDLAFLGGFFEGEGCIGAHYNNGHPFVFVKITNTDHSLIQWIHENFGGRVQKKGGKIPAHWKQSLDWYVRADDIIPFLKMLIPFLKSKRARAYRGMAIKTMIERKVSKGRIIQAIDELKAMNRRGRYSPLQ